MTFLSGYKTYIFAVVLFVIGGFLYLGIITTEQANSFAIMVGGVLGVTLRSAISKKK